MSLICLEQDKSNMLIAAAKVFFTFGCISSVFAGRCSSCSLAGICGSWERVMHAVYPCRFYIIVLMSLSLSLCQLVFPFSFYHA